MLWYPFSIQHPVVKFAVFLLLNLIGDFSVQRRGYMLPLKRVGVPEELRAIFYTIMDKLITNFAFRTAPLVNSTRKN